MTNKDQHDMQMSRKRRSREQYQERERENRVVRKIVGAVVTVLIVTLLIAAFTGYRYFKAGLEPLDTSNKKLVQVEVPLGSTSKDIGQILEQSKVIKSGLVFSYYVKTNNLSDFQAGFYQMAPNMTLKEITQMLKEGGTDEPEALADARLTIPEGYSISEIADLFAKKTDVTRDDFLNLMKDEKYFNTLAGKYPELLMSAKSAKDVRYRLEGYLFPATYNYYKEGKLEDLVEQMVVKTNNVLSQYQTQLDEIHQTKKLSTQQVLTLASLVEKEGVSDEDRRNIAQVFFNRLDMDMPLQSDISVLYAMEKHKVHLSNKDTQTDSPYNLYINKGTGPGPFNSPSEAAIQAVLNPEYNDYLYFLADVTDGNVYYAKTYEEHLDQKKQYIDDKR